MQIEQTQNSRGDARLHGLELELEAREAQLVRVLAGTPRKARVAHFRHELLHSARLTRVRLRQLLRELGGGKGAAAAAGGGAVGGAEIDDVLAEFPR